MLCRVFTEAGSIHVQQPRRAPGTGQRTAGSGELGPLSLRLLLRLLLRTHDLIPQISSLLLSIYPIHPIHPIHQFIPNFPRFPGGDDTEMR